MQIRSHIYIVFSVLVVLVLNTRGSMDDMLSLYIIHQFIIIIIILCHFADYIISIYRNSGNCRSQNIFVGPPKDEILKQEIFLTTTN